MMKLRRVLIRKGLSKLNDVNQLFATFRMMCNMSEDVFKKINKNSSNKSSCVIQHLCKTNIYKIDIDKS